MGSRDMGSNAARKQSALPPMLKHYLECKDQFPDCVILFQVGDFYEIFFEDAVTVSKALNVTLTSRDKNSPDPIPMCGVPIRVVDVYCERLLDQGFSIAIVSQCEVLPGHKGAVERKLERILTPGVRVLSHSESDSPEGCVAALVSEKDLCALTVTDVQSGVIQAQDQIPVTSVLSEISRFAPSEIIIAREANGKRIDKRLTWVRELDRHYTLKFRAASSKTSTSSSRDFTGLKGFTVLDPNTKRSVRLLLEYIDEITVEHTLPFSSVQSVTENKCMQVDATTRRMLELLQNVRSGSKEGSLLSVIDQTNSPGGTKLLRNWLVSPLLEMGEINKRQEAVEFLLAEHRFLSEVRSELKYLTDLERISARIELQVVSPSELGALRDSLEKVRSIRSLLDSALGTVGPKILSEVSVELAHLNHLAEKLASILSETPPRVLHEGGIFKESFNSELDKIRTLGTQGKQWIADLEAREKGRSGIQSLKIKFNNVLGYFFEVTKANASKVPEDFIARQSTANSDRFVTEELKSFEKEVSGAEVKQFKLEKELFLDLRRELLVETSLLRRVAQAVSILDVLSAFTDYSESQKCIRPVISDDMQLEIVAGRHPVLDIMIQADCIPNTLKFERGARNCLLLTGPNMGGKSTYLRQAGLLTILAQIGCFIPAESAKIGIVDQIFARIGASDDLTEGESTFMVEMKEASYIVSNATERSLVLIDEIGRGTATRDGLAIAQAILEWIVVKLKARCIFATHFHELVSLAVHHKTLNNISVGSYDEGDHVCFTHLIEEGPASSSYGIEVAKLAGLPKALIERAFECLSYERANVHMDTTGAQLSMFETSQTPEMPADQNILALRTIENKIHDAHLDDMTPREALAFLYELYDELQKK